MVELDGQPVAVGVLDIAVGFGQLRVRRPSDDRRTARGHRHGRLSGRAPGRTYYHREAAYEQAMRTQAPVPGVMMEHLHPTFRCIELMRQRDANTHSWTVFFAINDDLGGGAAFECQRSQKSRLWRSPGSTVMIRSGDGTASGSVLTPRERMGASGAESRPFRCIRAKRSRQKCARL